MEIPDQEANLKIAKEVMNQTDFTHGEIEETSAGNPRCDRCKKSGYWSDGDLISGPCVLDYCDDSNASDELLNTLAKRFPRIMVVHYGSPPFLWACCAWTGLISMAWHNADFIGEHEENKQLAIVICTLKSIGIDNPEIVQTDVFLGGPT